MMTMQSTVPAILAHTFVMIMVVTWFVDGSKVGLRPGRSYNQGPIPDGSYTIKEMEVFQVAKVVDSY